MSDFVILTRPEHRNAGLAARLEQDGINVACLPALRLQALVTCPDQMLWPQGFDLLVFVSGYAAQLYLDLLGHWRPGVTWPAQVRVATVGKASAEPLYQADCIPDDMIMHPGQGRQRQDSEGLWQVVHPLLSKIKHVLVVRGQGGREWLGAKFEQAGIEVTRLSLYRRVPETWDAAQTQGLSDALKAGLSPVFLLTSSESVDAVYANVQALALESEWTQCRFITIHERISAHLQTILQASGLYARHPIQICAPSDDAIYRAIRSSVSHSGSF